MGMAQQCGQMTGVLRGSNVYLVWGGHKINLGAGTALVGQHDGSVLRLRSGWRNRASPPFIRDTGSDKIVIPGAPFPDRAAEKAAQSIQFVYLWNKTQILSFTEGCCRKKENRRTFDRIDGVSAGPGNTEQPGSGGGGSPLLFLCTAGRYARTGAPTGGIWVRGGREGTAKWIAEKGGGPDRGGAG